VQAPAAPCGVVYKPQDVEPRRVNRRVPAEKRIEIVAPEVIEHNLAPQRSCEHRQMQIFAPGGTEDENLLQSVVLA
jgi:hypothetical protein